MDPTTVLTAFLAAFGILSADAVLHSDTVNVHISLPADVARTLPKDEVLEEVFISGMEEIVETKSYFGTPSIQSGHAKTVGSVLAHALKIEDFAAAIQHQFGMKVATVNASFTHDGGKLRLMSVVTDIDEPPFTQVITRETDEPLKDMLTRAAEDTMEHLAPYLSAVYLLNEGDRSGTYDKVDRLIAAMLKQYASSKFRKERASALNLAGIVALHRNDLEGAEKNFIAANDADPELLIPQINRAFLMLVTDHEQAALEVLDPVLVAARSRKEYVLLAAAEMTRAAAYMALNHLADAATALENAGYWDPTSSLVPALGAEVERLRGDQAKAAVLRARAADNLDDFETYPELASLYFKLSWKKGEPLVRNEVRPAAR